jgi:redox-sensitive bicupin YhaK (pirin superfamily)
VTAATRAIVVRDAPAPRCHRPPEQSKSVRASTPGSALIGQDAFLSVASLDPGVSARYALRGAAGGVYVHCARGAVSVGGVDLAEGDAVGLWEADAVDLRARLESELVLVEVPMTRGVRV